MVKSGADRRPTSHLVPRPRGRGQRVVMHPVCPDRPEKRLDGVAVGVWRVSPTNTSTLASSLLTCVVLDVRPALTNASLIPMRVEASGVRSESREVRDVVPDGARCELCAQLVGVRDVGEDRLVDLGDRTAHVQHRWSDGRLERVERDPKLGPRRSVGIDADDVLLEFELSTRGQTCRSEGRNARSPRVASRASEHDRSRRCTGSQHPSRHDRVLRPDRG